MQKVGKGTVPAAALVKVRVGKQAKSVFMECQTKSHENNKAVKRAAMYHLDGKVENLVRVYDQNARSGYLRLDLNENPGGLPQAFLDEALRGITPEMVAQYPETMSFTKTLAEYLKTDPAHLCLVNGSAEGIRYIIQVFTSAGGKIVGVTPSYFMFQVYAEMYGRNYTAVPYKEDLSIDAADIIAEITPDTQLLILLNPNNPMGNTYSEEEFKRIIDAAQEKQVTVLVDEAYHYFYPGTFIKYALNGEHIFITRTFSKLFSMAGCRLGYVVGWPDGIKMVQKMCTPHNTNVFALHIAQAMLKSPTLIDQLIQKYFDGRQYLIESLDSHGYKHKGEAGNFIFIKPKTEAGRVVEQMKREKKILIKMYPGVGELGDCLRASIGERQYMRRFIEALLEIDR